jgi:class 3 adenylate cyclase/predicted ATPase
LDIDGWLRGIGLAQYAEIFRANDIDGELLRRLTYDDLKDIGVVSFGHRKKLLEAIAGLAAAVPVSPQPALIEPKAHDAAERRQVTVMFSDLVGSTALSARMDPEDLRDVISGYQKCVAQTVQRFGGFVAKYMGDGVLVYFGYPQAHEDDAERAVRAGLELIQAVGRVGSGAPLQTRVGIATGLVVVGDLIGSGDAQERGIVGETPNLAARLQGIAEPNMVVIAESTRRLLGNLFDLQKLGAKDLKGIPEPVQAWAALRVSAVESRFEALRTVTTPLVGRDEEMALLVRRWEQAKAGEGQIVLVCGEPGIGKSRLAQTLVERLAGEPHIRLRFFCSPHHQDSALYPVIAHLERAANFRREDTTEQQLDKLEALLAQGTNDVSAVAPLLADLLAVTTGKRYPPLNLTPQKRKEKTLAALTAQVEGLSAREPVLMVYEDVHWSDPTTRESLDLLVDRLSGRRVLAIMTFRPEFSPPWIGRSNVTMLTLNRLAPRQRAQVIAHVIGGKALPKEISNQIIERTDGVPLFIEELTKSVVENGLVKDTGDSYVGTGPAAPLAIPNTLHASLLARLDRLAPTREVAQIGAALGRSFSHELISAVAQMPQHRLDETLQQLVVAELIFRRGTPPDAEYTFKHALVQDAAYSTLLRSRRQQLHGQIAATLESHFPEVVATEPEILARHCTEAGLEQKAVNYWLKAGQQAIARSTMSEAVAQLRKGLALLSKLPVGSARLELELNLQIELGHAFVAMLGYGAQEPGEAFARARELCQQLGEPPQLGQVLYGQLVFQFVSGELVQAESLAGEFRRLAEVRKDRNWTHASFHMSAVLSCVRGKLTDAHEYFENAISLWDPAIRTFIPSPEDPYVSVRVYFYRALLCLGYLDQARLRREEALAEARRLSPFNLAYALYQACIGHWALGGMGSVSLTLQAAEEIVAISSEHGFPLWSAVGMTIRGWCVGAGGQPTEGIELLLEGIAGIRAVGCKVMVPFYLTTLAEICGIARKPEEGLKRLDEAAQLIERTEERWPEAEVHRQRGMLLLSLREHPAAEASFQQALTVARRQSAKFWELRAAMSMARLWRDQGKRDEARDLLAPVYGWFSEGFDTRDLMDAKALLEELSS